MLLLGYHISKQTLNKLKNILIWFIKSNLRMKAAFSLGEYGNVTSSRQYIAENALYRKIMPEKNYKILIIINQQIVFEKKIKNKSYKLT